MASRLRKKITLFAVFISIIAHGILLWLPITTTTPNAPVEAEALISVQLITTPIIPNPTSDLTEAPTPPSTPDTTEAEPLLDNSEITSVATTEIVTPQSQSLPQPLQQTSPIAKEVESKPAEIITLDSSSIRQVALLSARQTPDIPSTRTLYDQQSSELLENWSQNALPKSLETREPVLEPLLYYGAAGIDKWKEPDGTVNSRVTLPNGTVACIDQGSSAHIPGEIETRFSTAVFLVRDCGQVKGGRENKNKLAKYHSSYPSQETNTEPP